MKNLIFMLLILNLLAAGCTSTDNYQPQVKASNNQLLPTPSPEQSVNKTPTPLKNESAKTEKAKCDPNYSGCVPIASDVDCAAGGGNGPAYVRGPVRVCVLR